MPDLIDCTMADDGAGYFNRLKELVIEDYALHALGVAARLWGIVQQREVAGRNRGCCNPMVGGTYAV